MVSDHQYPTFHAVVIWEVIIGRNGKCKYRMKMQNVKFMTLSLPPAIVKYDRPEDPGDQSS